MQLRRALRREKRATLNRRKAGARVHPARMPRYETYAAMQLSCMSREHNQYLSVIAAKAGACTCPVGALKKISCAGRRSNRKRSHINLRLRR
jgi:hypothetical protein